MPLVIVQRGNLSCPAIVCDHCGQEITTADDGNYQWHLGGPPAPQAVYFTHKRCCRAFEAAHPAPRSAAAGGWLWGAMELSCLTAYLTRALDIDPEQAAELADIMGSI